VAPPDPWLARFADLHPLFETGRGSHPNVWLLVAAGDRESFPDPLYLFMRAHASVWRRWESRPQPDLSDSEHGARPSVLLRRRETPAASPPPGQPPSCDETAYLFGAITDIEAFVAAAESAGALLDPTAECPPVSPSLAGTARYSAPLARWIGRVYATLQRHRPTLIQRTPPTTDGIELYVLNMNPWEASLLTIRLLAGQAAAPGVGSADNGGFAENNQQTAAPGIGGAEPAAAEAGPLASSSPNEVGIRAIHSLSGDPFDQVRLHDQCLAASAAAAEAGEADRRY
jgi:hypothetical protein